MYLLALVVNVRVNFQYAKLLKCFLKLDVMHFISLKFKHWYYNIVSLHLEASQSALSSCYYLAYVVVNFKQCLSIRLNLIDAALTINQVLEICPLDAINLYSNFANKILIEDHCLSFQGRLYRYCFSVSMVGLFELFIMFAVNLAGLE